MLAAVALLEKSSFPIVHLYNNAEQPKVHLISVPGATSAS